ncbi:hypothetical protein [Burkholderia ubonensis]|uniref:hypothetical protein n=1 Tax=Burkholderia ubonensis TaxID=101571 RepID=UPI0012F7A405|nr:hypothetical protein [Burkholderia ubonensis]
MADSLCYSAAEDSEHHRTQPLNVNGLSAPQSVTRHPSDNRAESCRSNIDNVHFFYPRCRCETCAALFIFLSSSRRDRRFPIEILQEFPLI